VVLLRDQGSKEGGFAILRHRRSLIVDAIRRVC
jgi:hypothetical protein